MSDDVQLRFDRIEMLLLRLVDSAPAREFYTVEQAAERLGLACWTVRNRCRLGEILAEKDRSGKWIIHCDEIDRLENNRHRMS